LEFDGVEQAPEDKGLDRRWPKHRGRFIPRAGSDGRRGRRPQTAGLGL